MHDDSHNGRAGAGPGLEAPSVGPVAAVGPASRHAGVEPLALRRAMGRFATGVAVVTTLDTAGEPAGITVNSLASVSLDPPLVLWSIDRRSTSWPTFRDAGAFAVNVLAAGGAATCRRFARRAPDRFAGLEWHRGPLGLPLLPGSLSQLVCRVAARHAGGDHEIIVGEVLFVDGRDGEPLLFHQGRLTPEAP